MKFWPGKKRASPGWTAVDAGPGGLCGVSVRTPESGNGKPEVVKCAFVPETDIAVEALAKLARKIGVPGFAWTTPLRHGDYKLVVLAQPAVKPVEMAQSLRWSLGPQIDFPVDEATLDWMSIPTQKHMPQRPPHLYAVVAKGDVIMRRAEPFRQAKIALQAVDIRETAQRNIGALAERPGEGLGMVAVSEQGVQIIFTFEGELYLDRFIEASLAAVVAADDETRTRAFERITLQVQRSIDLVNRTLSFIPLGRIVMAPMPAPLALGAHLAQNVTVPVETLDLASLFDFSLTPELAEEENQARFLVALGSALRGMGAAA